MFVFLLGPGIGESPLGLQPLVALIHHPPVEVGPQRLEGLGVGRLGGEVFELPRVGLQVVQLLGRPGVVAADDAAAAAAVFAFATHESQ